MGGAVPTFSALPLFNTAAPRAAVTAELKPWVRLQLSPHSNASVLWEGLMTRGLAVLPWQDGGEFGKRE